MVNYIDRDRFFLHKMQELRVRDTEWQNGFWDGVDDTLADMQEFESVDAPVWYRPEYHLPVKGSEGCLVAIRKYDGSTYTAYRSFERRKVRGKVVERWLYPWDRISNEEIVFWAHLPEPPKEEQK